MRYYSFRELYPEYGDMELHETSESFVYVHTHDFWELFYLTEGEVEHLINGHVVLLEKGDFVCVRPNDVHGYRCQEGKSYQMQCITVTDELFRKYLSLYSLDYDELHSGYETGIQYRLASKEFQEIVEEFKIVEHTRLLDEKQAKRHEAILLGECLKLFINRKELKSLPDWISKIVETANSPEGMQMKVSDIYGYSCYGKTQCIKLFKQYMGVTPGEYFVDCKIRYARYLLINTDLSVLEICGRIGYDSLSHFDHVFRRKIGVTPLQYRNAVYGVE